jgi:hypothetical protein
MTCLSDFLSDSNAAYIFADRARVNQLVALPIGGSAHDHLGYGPQDDVMPGRARRRRHRRTHRSARVRRCHRPPRRTRRPPGDVHAEDARLHERGHHLSFHRPFRFDARC